MSERALVKQGGTRYYANELAVALPQLREVQRKLRDALKVDSHEIDRSEALDLALLRLTYAPAIPRWILKTKLRDGEGYPRLEAALQAAKPNAELDIVLLALREEFAQAYDGWTPTVGKNRRVERVSGFPHVSGGGVGDPQPYEGALLERSDEGKGVRIGVLDTALVMNPWLKGGVDEDRARKANALIEVPNGAEAEEALIPVPPTLGHAAFVFGLILQRAGGAMLEIHRVLDNRAMGDTWTVARTIAELAASGAQLINVSLGCYTNDGQPPLVLARAIERLGNGVVVVAAAGNHGAGGDHEAEPDDADHDPLEPWSPAFPAALDSVVAVGAATRYGDMAAFSPDAPWVDLVAVGVDVQSTYLTGSVELRAPSGHQFGVTARFPGFATWSGASFAAATVTGAIAARVRPTNPAAKTAREALEELLGSVPKLPRQEPGTGPPADEHRAMDDRPPVVPGIWRFGR